ncbi:unnamed protein product [Dibothriocephalus latus]|uniref:MYST zinc finger domain-containing protein n=1 Tax=Dibothriocephalus latus TaxID=60516 RepID=A0A3P7MHG1_DIBLA|nr:unnamed protein product [Dibothriocephalus latus]
MPPPNNPRLLHPPPPLKDGAVNGITDDHSGGDQKQQQQPDLVASEPRFPSRIQLGKHIITTWYSAPYPSEYARSVSQRIFVCPGHYYSLLPTTTGRCICADTG